MEMVTLIGETEVVHKKERRARGLRPILGRVRNLLAFLFVATVLVFIFNYREDLQYFIYSNLYNETQVELKSSSLRQNALNHETEVNRIAE